MEREKRSALFLVLLAALVVVGAGCRGGQVSAAAPAAVPDEALAGAKMTMLDDFNGALSWTLEEDWGDPAVVEAAGGDAAQAADAAAISFQNTMGSVCDLVQGIVEIPCHTRNAVAASSAFVCADLILGGYRNPVPLDETVDAVLASGRMLPAELRCTARGGLAVTPSARDLKRRR